ncbi:MAG: hypothetical protein ACLFVU_13900 [Phycisphaerae bacterium]
MQIPHVLAEWEADPAASRLMDFSYAGYNTGRCLPPRTEGPVFDVRDHGVVPDDGQDHVAGVQAGLYEYQRTRRLGSPLPRYEPAGDGG